MRNSILAVLMVVAMVVISPLAKAQETDSCAQALTPCTPYINSATDEPPPACCVPLKAAMKNALPCVCSIFGNSEFMKAMNFNIEAALSLPKRCGASVNLVDYCKVALTPASSPALTPASSPGSDDASSPASDDDSTSPNLAPGPSTPIVTTTPGPSSSTARNTAMSGLVLLGSFLTLMLY